MTFWSEASAFVQYVGPAGEAAWTSSRAKKIVHIFHNSPYGKEAIPTLEHPVQAALRFELTPPARRPARGRSEKATWLQVRRIAPDWIYISGWGVMNQVAVKEAAARGMKMDRVDWQLVDGHRDGRASRPAIGAIGYKYA